MVPCQIVVVEDSDVKDCVVGAEAQVEEGAQADGFDGKVVLVGSSNADLKKKLSII